jgi:hypothetical protein
LCFKSELPLDDVKFGPFSILVCVECVWGSGKCRAERVDCKGVHWLQAMAEEAAIASLMSSVVGARHGGDRESRMGFGG